jgi:2-oxoglutarate ferredoxin oxidoreductase subunit alpha
MGIFGEGYRYHVTGLLHDVRGFPTLREDEIEPFMQRLFRKIRTHLEDIQSWENHLMEDAEVAIIAYGSVARSAKRAVAEARQSGLKAGLLRLITLWPFPRRAVESVLGHCSVLVVPEMNLGQISREVERVVQGRARVLRVSKALGRLIKPAEILEVIEGGRG